jgi:hypothetical protein
MQSQTGNMLTIQRLTALWALGESGLGGFMHALKLPFTGVFVGGFAVVIISLLAHFSNNNYRQMIQATLLVLLVKFAVSPQSPPQAYLAVGFQGVIGALMYRFIANRPVASVLFATIAMLESAFQKLLVMTLIYGKSLWEGLDTLYKGAVDNLFVPDRGFSFWLISIYVGIYFIWGLLLGIYIIGLPHKLELRTATVMGKLTISPGSHSVLTGSAKKKNKYRKLLNYLLIMALLVVVFAFKNDLNKAAYLVIRTFTVLLLFYMVINPIIKWWMTKKLANASTKNQQAISEILTLMPELRSFVVPAYKLAAYEHKGLGKYPAFVTNLIIIALNPVKNEE